MGMAAGKMSGGGASNSVKSDYGLDSGKKVKCPIIKDSPGNVENHSLQHVSYDEMTTSDDKMNDFGTAKG
jgi:flavin reductase (DIM6/NTAB) family NADH-FMN oxidoreductase RutF